jgi:hypothetical protein
MKGMAASYAKTWCEAHKSPNSVAAALAGTNFKPDRDALAHYGKADGTPDDRLRAIYALAISEGMRESSGNTTEGYDRTVKNQTEEIAEAGPLPGQPRLSQGFPVAAAAVGPLRPRAPPTAISRSFSRASRTSIARKSAVEKVPSSSDSPRHAPLLPWITPR